MPSERFVRGAVERGIPAPNGRLTLPTTMAMRAGMVVGSIRLLKRKVRFGGGIYVPPAVA